MSVFTEKSGVGNGVPIYYIQSRMSAAAGRKASLQARVLPSLQLIHTPTHKSPV